MADDAEADCRALEAELLPFAWQTLRRYGAFAPMGAAMRPDDEIVLVSADPGEGKRRAGPIIAMLRPALVRGAREGEFKATVLVYECICRIDPANPSDALAVCLDHRDGLSEIVFRSFRLDDADAEGRREVIEGPVFRIEGEGSVFAAPC
jgi:hypothetical protein